MQSYGRKWWRGAVFVWSGSGGDQTTNDLKEDAEIDASRARECQESRFLSNFIDIRAECKVTTESGGQVQSL